MYLMHCSAIVADQNGGRVAGSATDAIVRVYIPLTNSGCIADGYANGVNVLQGIGAIMRISAQSADV